MTVGTRQPVARGGAIVTGGAGFVGSHLADRLLAEGYRVLVIDDLSTGTLRNLAPDAVLETMDVASDDIESVFHTWRPRVVFHLAAQASVPVSMSHPLRDLAVNVVGTHRVGAAARAAGAEKLVFVSSGGAVYGESRRASTELSCPKPDSFYGLHKLAAEGHVAFSGMRYSIARPSNIYGPRQTSGLEGAVVAAFLDQAIHTGTLRIHGDGAQTRDFVHVRDVVDALWRLGDVDLPSGIWNVASGHRISIARLADIVEHVLGRPLQRVFGPRRPGDVTDSAISAARLRTLGWRTTVDLTAGIRDILASHPGRTHDEDQLAH